MGGFLGLSPAGGSGWRVFISIAGHPALWCFSNSFLWTYKPTLLWGQDKWQQPLTCEVLGELLLLLTWLFSIPGPHWIKHLWPTRPQRRAGGKGKSGGLPGIPSRGGQQPCFWASWMSGCCWPDLELPEEGTAQHTSPMLVGTVTGPATSYGQDLQVNVGEAEPALHRSSTPVPL